jgi:FAD/FMN-containing dehydrogenase
VQASTEDLDALFEELTDFNDSIMSNNEKEYNKIWKIREDVAVAAVREEGKVLAYDISFDVKQWPSLLEHLRKESKSLVMGYGHIGDGNLHVNLILKEGS